MRIDTCANCGKAVKAENGKLWHIHSASRWCSRDPKDRGIASIGIPRLELAVQVEIEGENA